MFLSYGFLHRWYRKMTEEIPIWVNGIIQWVSGVDRKTTCRDVIEAVLLEEGNDKRNVKDYTIMERWRRVERPLDENSKILKVSSWFFHSPSLNLQECSRVREYVNLRFLKFAQFLAILSRSGHTGETRRKRFVCVWRESITISTAVAVVPSELAALRPWRGGGITALGETENLPGVIRRHSTRSASPNWANFAGKNTKNTNRENIWKPSMRRVKTILII